MGEVFLAEDPRLKRRVAIKRVRSDAHDPDARRRLLVEARAAGRLDHPNICAIHEVGEDHFGPYIVMPFIDGETLSSRIARGPLPLDEAVRLAIQIADALSAAHALGILHRDIKSANVMIDRRGQARVMDFGLAKFAIDPAGGQFDVDTASRLTATGSPIGTAAYMSPEQVRGDTLDARSDLFNLGIVLYEMIGGRRPFEGQSLADTTVAILTRDPAPLARLRPDLPDELQRIVAKALRKRREERYQSSDDLLVDLRTLLPTLQRDTMPGVVPSRSDDAGDTIHRRFAPPRWVPLGLGFIVALGFGAWILTWLNRIGGTETPASDVPRIESLAVLPLDNLSGNPSEDFFAAGMTEALTTELARIKGVRVLSRTSTLRYKDTTLSMPEIARELGADGLVEGSVLRDGDRVRVTAQLIHGATDRHLWAENYHGDLRDVMTLQRRVAETIAREVRSAVSPEPAQPSDHRPIDPGARDEYLRGREQFYAGINSSSESLVRLERAVDHYMNAIRIQGDWGEAWGAIAEARHWMVGTGPDYQVVFPESREAALKAIALDDQVAIAHGALAYVSAAYDWDFVKAEREFTRAIELNPSYGFQHGYALLLSALGRHDEAIALFDQAEALDPMQLHLRLNATEARLYARRFDEALARASWLIEKGENPARRIRAVSYSGLGRHAEAIGELEQLLKEKPSWGRRAELTCALARAGRTVEARALLPGLERDARPANAFGLASVYASVGDRDRAVASLERAFARKSPWLAYANVDLCFDPVREDPRFREILERIGVPRSDLASAPSQPSR
jgi:serine/threonine protein kinase/tetratricopeptide (TPR) repeat protein